MNIAILGATSQIARDLVLTISRHAGFELVLFARNIEALTPWVEKNRLTTRVAIFPLTAFGCHHHDVLINFVGVGDPAKASAMAGSIMEITSYYDDLALAYLQKHSSCRYVFMSSGAVYGGSFDAPVSEESRASVPVNCVSAQDFYASAKLLAECKHRAHPDLPIVDVRVFNYFSHSQSATARFFISDAMRAIQSGQTLMTSPENIFRDYIGPDDFHQLILTILNADPANDVVDCYTRTPVDKFSLLNELQRRYGLNYAFLQGESVSVNATGFKRNYFSLNRRAGRFGYNPSLSSLETVVFEADRYFSAAEQ